MLKSVTGCDSKGMALLKARIALSLLLLISSLPAISAQSAYQGSSSGVGYSTPWQLPSSCLSNPVAPDHSSPATVSAPSPTPLFFNAISMRCETCPNGTVPSSSNPTECVCPGGTADQRWTDGSGGCEPCSSGLASSVGGEGRAMCLRCEGQAVNGSCSAACPEGHVSLLQYSVPNGGSEPPLNSSRPATGMGE